MPAKNLGSISQGVGAVNRRSALTVLASAGATVGLAACASEPSSVATTPPSGTVTETSAAPSGRQLLGKTTDIPVGSGARFKVGELEFLVTQPAAGDFQAFDATCTHAGCIVTGVIDGEIACACHGARFDMASGAVTGGPARSALGRVPITIEGEEIFVTL